MQDLFTLHNLFTLGMLILLQAVLGFDNLLYISIESKRVAEPYQSLVRRLGIGLAIILRLVLLFVLMAAIKYFQKPFFELHFGGIVEGSFNLHSVIVLVGGTFIIYTAVKEIMHMLAIHDVGHDDKSRQKTVGHAVFWIVLMNLVFSFDSILSAIALSEVFVVIATSIVIGGLLMILLADHVAEFLKKNRMYEVLGLFILFVVGVMLVSEGGHLAKVHLFVYVVEPMAKSTFYFVIGILVIVDLVQSRYQKKLLSLQKKQQQPLPTK